MLDLMLCSQNELVDNVKVHEPLGSSDHNQIHFDLKVKKKKCFYSTHHTFHIVTYISMLNYNFK